MGRFKAKVTKKISIRNKFVYLKLDLIELQRIKFEPWQYIDLDIGGESRSYSIASSPKLDKTIELGVDISPDGKGSRYIQDLKKGDEVGFTGPSGRMAVSNKEKKLLMVTVGAGITPLRSLIWDLLVNKKDKRLTRLLWGLRFLEKFFWVEEFRRFQKLYPHFQIEMTKLKPPQNWAVCDGDVRKLINKEQDWGQEWEAYVCGNVLMVPEVAALLQKKGIPAKQIYFDKYE